MSDVRRVLVLVIVLCVLVVNQASAATQKVVMSELAWAGTRASSTDEWFELHNDGQEYVILEDWVLFLVSCEGPDDWWVEIEIPTTVIEAGQYKLFERTDDTATSMSGVPYTGGMKNTEVGSIALVDKSVTPNVVHHKWDGFGDCESWPHGDNNTKASASYDLETGEWYTSLISNGARDEGNNPIIGTPGSPNLHVDDFDLSFNTMLPVVAGGVE